MSIPSIRPHEEMLQWYGGEFDPEDFNLEDTNQLLAAF